MARILFVEDETALLDTLHRFFEREGYSVFSARGLTEALAIAMGQDLSYDEIGNVQGGSLMDFFLPTAVETPTWETDHTTTPSPHHPIGAKGVGESPNVGGVPALSNAINDAFAHKGLTHTQMPHDHWRVWQTAKSLGLTG